MAKRYAATFEIAIGLQSLVDGKGLPICQRHPLHRRAHCHKLRMALPFSPGMMARAHGFRRQYTRDSMRILQK
jgi:hypothetical protein